MMEHSPAFELLRRMCSQGYVVLDVVGLASIIAASVVLPNVWPWSEILRTVGATLVTLGLSLPIVLFAQAIQSEQTFHIVNTCKRVGIDDIFASRTEDGTMLAKAINDAARGEPREVCLLGIALPDLLKPENLQKSDFGQKVYNPSIKLRVLLLDPSSAAAARREEIEVARGTIGDIRERALSIFLPGIVHFRLQKLAAQNAGLAPNLDDLVEVCKVVGISVGVYAQDPAVYLVGFSHCVFAEQYHSGRPKRWPHGACIGGYMPVIQYDQDSAGFRHLRAHFEYLCNGAQDKTLEVVASALKTYPAFMGLP